MANYKEKLESDWLKAKVNVEHGDTIRIIDDFEDEEGNVIINVGLLQDNEIIKQKKFRLNKTNLKTIIKAYGFESEKWKGKDFQVSVYKARNPQKDELVDAILLSLPNMQPDTDIEGF
jgi:hypothetical protein